MVRFKSLGFSTGLNASYRRYFPLILASLVGYIQPQDRNIQDSYLRREAGEPITFLYSLNRFLVLLSLDISPTDSARTNSIGFIRSDSVAAQLQY